MNRMRARTAARMSSSDLALPCMIVRSEGMPAVDAMSSSPAPTTSTPTPSSASTRRTATDGLALDAKHTIVSA